MDNQVLLLSSGTAGSEGFGVAPETVSAEDSVARRGMRMLGNAIKGDPQVVSGESGAASFGALATIMLQAEYKDLREELGLDANAKVLCFSTEGDTDPERYRRIVWEGLDQ